MGETCRRWCGEWRRLREGKLLCSQCRATSNARCADFIRRAILPLSHLGNKEHGRPPFLPRCRDTAGRAAATRELLAAVADPAARGPAGGKHGRGAHSAPADAHRAPRARTARTARSASMRSSRATAAASRKTSPPSRRCAPRGGERRGSRWSLLGPHAVRTDGRQRRTRAERVESDYSVVMATCSRGAGGLGVDVGSSMLMPKAPPPPPSCGEGSDGGFNICGCVMCANGSTFSPVASRLWMEAQACTVS